jgi:serine/threonine protein kinase
VSVSADPRIGGELLGYRIEALIGRGGMSAVYRAEDLRLNRKVALKLLASELAVDDRFRDRFLRESQLAASIDHPHIVPIYEAGEVDGQLYIAMRYVEGSDLKQLLRKEGPLDPRRTLQLLTQLADALDAAHDRGLVHRDVKPSNALLDSDEHLYLADFGLTKSASDRSRPDDHGPDHRNGRLRRPGADRGQVRRRASRRLLARLPALRVPDGRGALPARLRAGRALGPCPRAAAEG